MMSAGTHVDIAICATPTTVLSAVERWPDATVLALVVPARNNGSAVGAVLAAGANVCVGGDNLELIAAHVRAAARRRGLPGEDGPR